MILLVKLLIWIAICKAKAMSKILRQIILSAFKGFELIRLHNGSGEFGEVIPLDAFIRGIEVDQQKHDNSFHKRFVWDEVIVCYKDNNGCIIL